MKYLRKLEESELAASITRVSTDQSHLLKAASPYDAFVSLIFSLTCLAAGNVPYIFPV